MIVVNATHYGATLHYKGRSVPVPATVGKEDTKSPKHRARNLLFNHMLGKVWATRHGSRELRNLHYTPDLVSEGE